MTETQDMNSKKDHTNAWFRLDYAQNMMKFLTE